MVELILVYIKQTHSEHRRIPILLTPLCSRLRAVRPSVRPGLGAALNTSCPCCVCSHFFVTNPLRLLLTSFHLWAFISASISVHSVNWVDSLRFAFFSPPRQVSLPSLPSFGLRQTEAEKKRRRVIEHLQLSWKCHCQGFVTASAFIAFYQEPSDWRAISSLWTLGENNSPCWIFLYDHGQSKSRAQAPCIV